MFETSIHPVHPFLNRYINAYATMKLNQDEPFSAVFTAKPDSVLMFNIGHGPNDISIGFDFVHQPEKRFDFRNQDAWFGGMITKPLAGHVFAHTHVLCVVLKPIGVYHFLKESSASMVNEGYSFETLGLHRYFDGLIDSLHGKTDMKVILPMVEKYFINYFTEKGLPFSVKDMTPVMQYIERQKGIIQVKQLEEKFHISERWLEKQFLAQVGLSPKEFARLIRFKSVMVESMMTPSVSWAKMIHDYGYYDQSHLIKDFQNYTGQTPTAFIKQIEPTDAALRVNTFFYDLYD
jgi:AraC-like DNA-binding protein